MNHENTDIVKCLWENFEHLLKREVPVYFTFTRYNVSRLVADQMEIINLDEAYEVFLKHTRKMLKISGGKVFIAEEAYKQIWGDKCSVILLVALQILAVELMNNQGTDFTQNAYFPRLRELISDELPLESLLPFDSEEYEKIWSTFANEIKGYYKSKQAIITFDIKATQSFKNKIMPLSQALLSHSDLAKLGIILHDSGQLQIGAEIDYEFFFRKYFVTVIIL